MDTLRRMREILAGSGDLENELYRPEAFGPWFALQVQSQESETRRPGWRKWLGRAIAETLILGHWSTQ
jgi:hypothetical protein